MTFFYNLNEVTKIDFMILGPGPRVFGFCHEVMYPLWSPKAMNKRLKAGDVLMALLVPWCWDGSGGNRIPPQDLKGGDTHQWFFVVFSADLQFQCMKGGGKAFHFCGAKTEASNIKMWCVQVNECISTYEYMWIYPSRLRGPFFHWAIFHVFDSDTQHQNWSFILS